MNQLLPSELAEVQRAGLAELDRAEQEILGAARRPDDVSESEREKRACELRLDFACNHHLSTRGRRLEFDDPWLLPIYEDRSARKVIQKSVQVGISEFLVVYALADAAVGRTVFYVLPTFDVRNRFVDQRVNRPLILVARYRQLDYEATGEARNKGLRNFGAGAMYFVSADTPRSFIEVAADTAIVDEMDRCDFDNLAMVGDRLEHADLPVRIEVGNPTHADYGISRAYAASDQRQWLVRCRACNHWQELDFFAHVLRVNRDEAGEILDYECLDADWRPELDRDIRCYCAKCGKPLDRRENDPKFAQWIAAEPGHPVTGWRLGKLMTRRASVRSMLTDWSEAQGNPTKTARFVNNICGRAYSPAGSALTDTMLNACKRGGVSLGQSAAGPCTMGIDVGRFWDVRISDSPEIGVRRARLIGRFAAMEPCLDLIERFHVDCCVIDARPETELAKRFQRAAQDRMRKGSSRWIVWRCDFHRGENIGEVSTDPEQGIVKVDRTAIFDQGMADIRLRRNWLPEGAEHLLGGDYYAQMREPKRQLIETPSGEQRYIWTKGVDHQRLADVYDKIAQLIRPKRLCTQFFILGADNEAPAGWDGLRNAGSKPESEGA